MKIIEIKAYEYAELDENAKDNFIVEMYKTPFDYETEENGKIITKYDYFSNMTLSEQIEFCEMNEYLFDKYGNIINFEKESKKDNERLKGFLTNDLKKLEIQFNHIKENFISCDIWDKTEIEHFDNFFSYWHIHAKDL